MATKTCNLAEVRTGDFIFWTVCSQCLNLATIVIRDNKKIYQTINKVSFSTAFNVLAQTNSIYTGGGNLRIEISIPASTAIDSSQQSYAITDKEMNSVGHGYNICIEDAGDKDYNDIYIDFVAWNKKG